MLPARDRRRVECPFETGARFDRINFPDVLDALPPRASAFGTPLNGIRGGGEEVESGEQSHQLPLELVEATADIEKCMPYG